MSTFISVFAVFIVSTPAVILVCVCSSLRPIDIEFMKHLSKVVNIVPVIAKADTLTLEERDFFKKKVKFTRTHNHTQLKLEEEVLDPVRYILKQEVIYCSLPLLPFCVCRSGRICEPMKLRFTHRQNLMRIQRTERSTIRSG